MHHHDPEIVEHDHMAPPRTFLTAWLILLVLTAVEVSVVLVFALPAAMRVTILLITACLKASLIGAYYMNLKFERLVMMYVIVIPLIALALVMFWGVVPDAARILGLH
ncbi:MAG TPA: cytochrome C oxidase subunit IV family protein [bacterium]|nr:cytochrome C oxidase subunit IV family protein [bacterium]